MSDRRLMIVALIAAVAAVGSLVSSVVVYQGMDRRGDARERHLTALSADLARQNAAIERLAKQVDAGQIDKVARQVETLAAQQEALFNRQKAIYGFLTVPTIEGLTLGKAAGLTVKIKLYEIDPGIDILGTAELKNPGRGVEWNPEKPTDLLIPWTEQYIKEFKQEFSPGVFARNMVGIADRIRGGAKAEKYGAVLRYLIGQLDKYSDEVDGARYVKYDFQHVVMGLTLPRGWHSALGNGMVAMGLVELSKATGDAEYMELARLYIEGLLRPSDIVLADQSGYLWLEECPPVDGKMMNILNGHIWAIWALYHWHQATGDERALPVIRAAITTMHRYLPEYRRPGEVTTYGRLGDWRDYAPHRIVNFIDALHRLTGEPFFAEYASVLRTDMTFR